MKGEFPKISANIKMRQHVWVNLILPCSISSNVQTPSSQKPGRGDFSNPKKNHRDPTVCSSLLIFKKLTFTYAKGQKKWKIYWKGNFISHEANMLKKPLHSISSLVWNAESRAELFHIVSASETGAWKQHVRDLFVAPCLSTGEFCDIDSNLTSWKQEGGP